MPTINDYKKSALKTLTGLSSGDINTLEYKWLRNVVSPYVGSIPDMWRKYLTNLGYTSGALNDRFMKYLGNLGYAGSLNNRWYQYWKDVALIRSLFAAGQEGAWYDPSDMSSVFTDTAGTSPVTADGDLVARINDKSGRGHHLLQANSAKRPLYKISGARRWLESDGIDDSMQVTISGWTDLTAVVANAILQDGTGPISFEIAAATRADTLFQMNAPSNNGTCATTARGAAFAIQAQGITAFSVGVAQVRSSRLKQDDFQFWKNGVSLATDASGIWPASPLAVLSLFSAIGGTANFGKEKFYGSVVRAPVLSNTERQTAETYLAGKAGIPL